MMTPSAVRNKLEVRVRKIAGSTSIDDRIKASDEMFVLLDEYLTQLYKQKNSGQK